MRIVYETNHIPIRGKYKNVVLEDPTLTKHYLYDSQGSFILLDKEGPASPPTTPVITAGANVSISGAGTQQSPYIISSTGGGGGGGGSGAVSSVAGKIGDVVLVVNDVTGLQAALDNKLSAIVPTFYGNTTFIKNDTTDQTFTIQNTASGKATYVNLLSNGGTTPYMNIAGFSGTTIANASKLWQLGNFGNGGLTIYTNSSSGYGYNQARVLAFDYSQNTTIFGNLTPDQSVLRDIGSTGSQFRSIFARKHYFGATTYLDGSTSGQIIVTGGSFVIPTNAGLGKIATSDANGGIIWSASIGAATAQVLGTIKITNDLDGTANNPVVKSFHLATAGGYMTAIEDGSLWRLIVHSDGSLETVSGSGSGGVSGQIQGLPWQIS